MMGFQKEYIIKFIIERLRGKFICRTKVPIDELNKTVSKENR